MGNSVWSTLPPDWRQGGVWNMLVTPGGVQNILEKGVGRWNIRGEVRDQGNG